METTAKSHVWVTTIILLAGISSADIKYSGGSGTAEDPYQIATAADLIALGDSPGDYGKHFVLTADLDLDPSLPGRKVFTKAVIAPDVNGTNSEYDGTPFTGVFDGKGHSLSHLPFASRSYVGTSYVGLFGKLGFGGKITNLGMEAVDVNVPGGCIGSLVAHNDGWIALSHSEACGIKTFGTVGGLVGVNKGSLVASYSTGSITGAYVGGLVGANEGSIIASYSTCTILNGYHAGGLVGENTGSITASYSAGAVSGDESAGGLVGYARGQGSITMCYSTGAVTSRKWWLGGLIGHNEDWETCVATSFWDTETSGQLDSRGGVGLTTAKLQDIKTFMDAGWDFADEVRDGVFDFWQMSAGEYPRLRYHTGAGPVMPEGLGTPEQPYVIRDARDLGTLWCEPMACCCLTGHVDLAGITWPAAVIPWFGGTFDGRGFAFRHLHIQGGGYLGLFGVLGPTATISNLGLDGAHVSGDGIYVGGLAGLSQASITACYSVDGVITSTGAVGRSNLYDRVGGLVGENRSRISASRCIGIVKGRGGGGLVGHNEIEGWIATSYSGGLVQEGDSVGGLVGSNCGHITVSHSTCTVQGRSGAGGLVGTFVEGQMSQCYSTGAVHGYNSVGGLMGSMDLGEVSQCYSTGAVCGRGYAGGLVGWNEHGALKRCYSAGAVHGDSFVGGLVAETETGTATDCLWDVQASGQTASAGGTGMTTAQMQDISTFLSAGWDFVEETANGTCDYWQMAPGEYPRFRYHAANGPVMPEGAGTPEQPYLIRDARDLGTMWFEPMAHYRLAEPVNLWGITWSMAPIPWFGGTFDGNRCVISDLRIRGRDNLGLFGRLGPGAKVFGLGLEEVDVNGTGDCVGALVGHNDGGRITTSYSEGTVAGRGAVGGLVGSNYGDLAASCSSAAVAGLGAVGGLVGDNHLDASIVTSYSTGLVTGGKRTGGLVGLNYCADVVMSYSTGAVMGGDAVGGLVGLNDWGSATASFWDSETSGQAMSGGGTGKTTAEMHRAATFLAVGWDFAGETANGAEDIWWILEGQDHPRLWWETAED